MSLAELPEHPFAAPRTLDELTELLAGRAAAGEETVLLAGGTDWIVERHLAPPAPGRPRALVADVSRLAELRGVDLRGDTLDLGAAATFLEIARNPVVEHRVPLLRAAFRDVGAVQIQARGTLGGNLATASPAGDGVAALAALDTTILLASVRGTRRVPLAGFYTGYKRSVRAADEVIARIEIVLPPRGARWSWRKVGTRQAQSISKVAFAAVAVMDGAGREARIARIGLGMASVAPTVTLLPAVRALALSRPPASIPASEIDAAVDADISPIDDIRSTAAYRRHVAKALVRNFLLTGSDLSI